MKDRGRRKESDGRWGKKKEESLRNKEDARRVQEKE